MKLSTALSITLLSIGSFGGFNIALGAGPVSDAMKKMSGSLLCIKGTLPAERCQFDHLVQLREGAAAARTAMVTAAQSDRHAEINELFDRVDQGVESLAAALGTDDAAAKEHALGALDAVMREGHRIFRPRPQ